VQGCGDQIYYFSEDKIHDSEREYKESVCEVDKYNKAQEGKDGAFTTTETGAEGCGAYWICDSEILNDEESYNEKCVKDEPKCYTSNPPCKIPRFYTNPQCLSYSKCMGYI